MSFRAYYKESIVRFTNSFLYKHLHITIDLIITTFNLICSSIKQFCTSKFQTMILQYSVRCQKFIIQLNYYYIQSFCVQAAFKIHVQ